MVVICDHQDKPRRYPVLSTKRIGILLTSCPTLYGLLCCLALSPKQSPLVPRMFYLAPNHSCPVRVTWKILDSLRDCTGEDQSM